MQRKRNPKTFLIKKQKKMIDTRLMQISLKVDDYIYKNVPISVKNAVMFIKEVTGYEDKCFEDTRTLQVIEKLIRCMKGIIKEQEEIQEELHPGSGADIDDVTLVDVNNILALPIDDDLTQFTQEIDVDKILDSPKNNIKLGSLDDHNGKVTIDLCDDENKINQEERHSHENLQKAISNLSIRCEDDPLSITHFNLEDCSQSILNNLDCSINIDGGKGADKNKSIFSQDFEEIIQPATITKGSRIATSVTNVSQTRTMKTRTSSQLHKVSNCDLLKVIVSSAKNNCKTNKKYPKEKAQRKRRKVTTNKDNEKENNKQTAKTKNKRTALTKRKQKNIEAVKQNDKKTTAPEKDNMALEKLYKGEVAKKRNEPEPDESSFSYGNENSNAHASAETQYNQKNNSIEKAAFNLIYNKDIENDLSWIENIRYVREIPQEENIPAHFGDSFWENYTLPYDWNNDDFL